MCGIAGWIDYKGCESGKEIIQKMADSMAHRGPDDEGFFYDGKCALAHRRLAVIDINGGRQPMKAVKHGREFVIVYNGELYNTEEIRQELIARHYRFDGHSDTEVLLYSYIEWGEACLEKLNGIYAFAIWESRKKQLFIARDRAGVKPLFFYEYNGGLIFASEIKTLLVHPFIKPVIDKEGISQIMLLGPAHIPGSGVFKGICELTPGECGTLTERKFRRRKYWSIRATEHTESLEETKEHLRYLITDSIKRQLVCDVPLCTFLSGGLDSSIITAIASEQYKTDGRTLSTYSVDYADNDKNFTASRFQPDRDEYWINRMTESTGSHHTNYIISNDEITANIEQGTFARDLPGMADIDSSLYLFCREIKKNFTVALSGECADEIFDGYPWFHDESVLFAKGFPWARSQHDRVSLLEDGFISEGEADDYIDKCARKTSDSADFSDSDTDRQRRMREMFMLNFEWFMQTLLVRKDRESMAWGLEVRVPFCDHRIINYAYNIPWEMKSLHSREKGLVREAMTGLLPDDVLWRKKSPYPKTYDPKYLSIMIQKVQKLTRSRKCRMTEFLSKKKILSLCENPDSIKNNWYGQLMTAPQVFAYLVQLEAWMRKYEVVVER